MAQYQTGDGRWLVGDVTGESNYYGFLGWRDCVIQLTEDGATEQSVRYLEALRDYALAHNPLGEPIMPPSINVWISNNGTTTAVQADDVSVDGEKFTIGGIAWDGSEWDYSNAGKTSGGDPGYTVTEERVVVIPEQTVETEIFEGNPFALGSVTMSEDVSTLPDSLHITFNEIVYDVPKQEVQTEDGTLDLYGAIDFITYPFFIMPSAVEGGWECSVATQTAQTVTIKAEAVTKVVEVSEDFQMARGYTVSGSSTEIIPETSITTVLDGTTAISEFEPRVTQDDIADVLLVTFDGVDYRCEKQTVDGVAVYGADVTGVVSGSFDKPFLLGLEVGQKKVVHTPEAGTHTIQAKAVRTVVPSDDFKEAVTKVSELSFKPFVVTLTPTAADFSGTMDKTIAEINAAYKAGRKIIAKLYTASETSLEIPLFRVETDENETYSGFQFATISSGMIVVAWTGTSSDGTESGYATDVYALTPAT